MGRNFHILNIGCRVNRTECDSCQLALVENGWMQTEADLADLIIINTCVVTSTAAKKTRKLFKGMLSANKDAKIIVSGCASAVDAAYFQSFGERVEVVPKVLLLDSIKGHIVNKPDLVSHEDCQKSNGVLFDGRARVGIKVQDGCNNECTYCIVRIARGREVSVPVDTIVEQAVKLDMLGIAEIVLSGINLARYQSKDTDLTGLLKTLTDLGLRSRFRISSVEPNDIGIELAQFLESCNGKVCRHLHLPLQSGSSKVLSEMGRLYSAEEYLDKIDMLKRSIPQISLTTDVICGFPGETDQDFEETIELCKAVGFSKIHVFPYSRRKGTPAAERCDQVNDEVRRQRAQRLRQLSDKLRTEDYKRRIGTTELCVIEDGLHATTESYHTIKPPESSEIGSMIPIRL